MLAGRLAKEQGADEALLVTPHGRVLEGPTWTFFWVAAAACTRRRCPTGSSTRSRARRLLEECDVTEAPCTLDDVRAAEEAFIASSVREVMPIAAVDDIALPRAPGPVTEAAHAAFRQRVERELAAQALPRERLDAAAPPPVSPVQVPEQVPGGADRRRVRCRGPRSSMATDTPMTGATTARVLTVIGNRPQFIKAAAVSGPLRDVADEVLVHTGQHYDDDALAGLLRRARAAAARAPARPRRRQQHRARRRACSPRSSRCCARERPDARARLRRHELDARGRARRAPRPGSRSRTSRPACARTTARCPRSSTACLTDHASDLLLCSSEAPAEILRGEAVSGEIEVVGDVMVDVARLLGPARRGAHRGARALRRRSRARTCSRPRTGPATSTTRRGWSGSSRCSRPCRAPVVLPLHPRTARAAGRRGPARRGSSGGGVVLAPPLGYLDFTALLQHARAVLTDSGGVQKEAYLAGVPCVTLRVDDGVDRDRRRGLERAGRPRRRRGAGRARAAPAGRAPAALRRRARRASASSRALARRMARVTRRSRSASRGSATGARTSRATSRAHRRAASCLAVRRRRRRAGARRRGAARGARRTRVARRPAGRPGARRGRARHAGADPRRRSPSACCGAGKHCFVEKPLAQIGRRRRARRRGGRGERAGC